MQVFTFPSMCLRSHAVVYIPKHMFTFPRLIPLCEDSDQNQCSCRVGRRRRAQESHFFRHHRRQAWFFGRSVDLGVVFGVDYV